MLGAIYSSTRLACPRPWMVGDKRNWLAHPLGTMAPQPLKPKLLVLVQNVLHWLCGLVHVLVWNRPSKGLHCIALHLSDECVSGRNCGKVAIPQAGILRELATSKRIHQRLHGLEGVGHFFAPALAAMPICGVHMEATATQAARRAELGASGK